MKKAGAEVEEIVFPATTAPIKYDPSALIACNNEFDTTLFKTYLYSIKKCFIIVK